MIVVAIVAIIGSLIFSAVAGFNKYEESQQPPAEIVTVDVRCVEGYKVLVSNMQSNQILDENGKAIPCTTE